LIIQSLSLQNFRNYREKTFNFGKQTILLVGPNASGKTNVLEAICLLGWGKSFRADLDRQMISEGETLARVKAKLAQDACLNKLQLTDLEVILTSGEVQGKKTASKIFKINGVGRRWRDFVGRLKVVLFRPEDIEIILGSPSIRRAYLDSVLSQVDSLYRQCHLVYEKGLRQRNRLLEKIRKGEARLNQLEYWNRLLLKKRRDYQS
jgi:DNA replication and repair protein RecF